MRIISYFSLFLALFFFAAPVQALDVAHFTQTEYSFNVNEPTTLDMAPRSLSGERAGYYDFINFEPGNKEKHATYLDTADRQFQKNSLIIRVREDLKKPHKSKITVKLRAASPEKFGDVKNYKKAEIDIAANGEKKYSVSYDIKYNPEDIDVRKVDVKAVFDRIKKKSPDAWALVEPVYTQYGDKIEQTIVMRALSWEGPITKVAGEVEVDYAIWSPLYRYPKMFIPEISFKGKTSDANLEKVALRIKDELTKKGIYTESGQSKTKATFEASPNFK